MIQENNFQNISNNPLNNKITEGISIFTVCKNRETFLEQALSTWVLLKEVDEIIIIDWSSDNSLIPLIEKYQNGKIILAIVPEQEKFNLSCSYNFAARLTSKSKIFKVDSDILISKDFFSKHILNHGEFISGNWEIARNENEKHLNGNVYLYREDFFQVNGFNEYLRTYGWDDSDLFERLQSIGLHKKDINNDSLTHIEHSGRTQFIKNSDNLKNIKDDEHSMLHILLNQQIASFLPKWSKENKMWDFSIEKIDNHIFRCIYNGDDTSFLSKEIINECEKHAIINMFKKAGINIPSSLFKSLKHDEIIELYNYFLSDNFKEFSLYLILLLNKYYYTLKEQNEITLEIELKNKEILKKELEIKYKDELLKDIINSYSFKLGQTLLLPFKIIFKKKKF